MTLHTRLPVILCLSVLMASLVFAGQATPPAAGPTTDDGSWYVLTPDQLPPATQNTTHLARFGDSVDGYNRYVLRAIDKAQATAMDGGGYFIGIKADPPESPMGYALSLMGKPLLDPPRHSSYCSGATYTAFIEALNFYEADAAASDGKQADHEALDPVRAEAMRMQEPDGGRREDGVKFWGHWNADGFGNDFALVQYAKMGEVVSPKSARPGDFMNISWNHGGGHSVVFLGWYKDDDGNQFVHYWSSQKGSNGMGDQLVPLSRIQNVKIVRLTDPDRLFTFDPNTPVDKAVPGDTIDW